MGNDGGSIPTRRELVKNAARNPNTTELKASQLESQTHAWTFCPLSNKPLSTPIVSDCAGILYNKDAVLEHLLPDSNPSLPIKSDTEESVGSRIKSLKDVVEIRFQTETDKVTKQERRICPVLSKELGASTRAVYLVPCGHAYSETAIKEVGDGVCMTCNEPYNSEDVIPIVPLAKSDIARLEERIIELKAKGLTHSLKKASGSKKNKKSKHTAEAAVKEIKDDHAPTDDAPQRTKKRSAESQQDIPNKNIDDGVVKAQTRNGATAPSGGIKNAATASLTARVLEEQEERNKRRKLGLNDNLKSLFSRTGSIGQGNGTDFMTRGFSIPKKT